MKPKTRSLAKQVQDALLALPDAVLLETLNQWLDLADEELQYLDWSDEYRYKLGYRVQSYQTKVIYASFEELGEAEDEPDVSWVVPDIGTQRKIISQLSVEDFYHTILDLASKALALQASEERWGSPPSVISDGYAFMRCIATHLHAKTLQPPELEEGHIYFPQPSGRRRKPMKLSSAELASLRLHS